MRFVFTANSPGEVATWLTPTVRALKRVVPAARIAVFIVPCAFAAGTEADVVRALPEVDDVYGPRDYWRIAFGGRLPAGWAPDGTRGSLLYLGGDLVHAVRLARRMRLPALAYVERGSPWTKSFVELLVADEEAQRRVVDKGEAPSRVRIVGNLMVDAVQPSVDPEEAAHRFGVAGPGPVVAVFPGSRPYEIEFSLPFLLRALEQVQHEVPSVRPLISLSSFAPTAVLQGRVVAELEGASLRVREAEGARGTWVVDTDGGLSVPALRGAAYDIMQVADLAVTLPGSNTAEMAAAGLPMVVVLPLNLAEKIPLPGAAHYVEKLPLVGTRVKRRLVRRLSDRTPFVSWPNRKAGTALVPEVRGNLRAADVARVVLDLLRDVDRRGQMGASLREVLGPAGAAERIVHRMLAAAGVSASENEEVGLAP